MAREERKTQIQVAATKYFEGLAKKDFDLIPYEEGVVLQAPLAPGGVHNPMRGKEALRTQWWAPLPGILGRVRILDIYYNDELTAVMAEAEVEVTDPPTMLRVADRFTVNDAGKIVAQINYFDPRDVTNPGWQKKSG